MKKQIFSLMVGTALCGVGPVFAMDSSSMYDEYKRTNYSPNIQNAEYVEKIDRSQLNTLDVDNLNTLDIQGFNAFYAPGYKNGFVKTPTGDVYGVDSMVNFQASVTYLRNKPFDTSLQNQLNLDIMGKGKNTNGDEVRFIYTGGALTLPNPWHSYMPTEPKTMDCVLINQEIVLNKIAPTYYY